MEDKIIRKYPNRRRDKRVALGLTAKEKELILGTAMQNNSTIVDMVVQAVKDYQKKLKRKEKVKRNNE